MTAYNFFVQTERKKIVRMGLDAYHEAQEARERAREGQQAQQGQQGEAAGGSASASEGATATGTSGNDDDNNNNNNNNNIKNNDNDNDNDNDTTPSTTANSNSNSKPGEKISFEVMGKTIGRSWKRVPKDDLLKYQALAEADMRRYEREKTIYAAEVDSVREAWARRESLRRQQHQRRKVGGGTTDPTTTTSSSGASKMTPASLNAITERSSCSSLSAHEDEALNGIINSLTEEQIRLLLRLPSGGQNNNNNNNHNNTTNSGGGGTGIDSNDDDEGGGGGTSSRPLGATLLAPVVEQLRRDLPLPSTILTTTNTNASTNGNTSDPSGHGSDLSSNGNAMASAHEEANLLSILLAQSQQISQLQAQVEMLASCQPPCFQPQQQDPPIQDQGSGMASIGNGTENPPPSQPQPQPQPQQQQNYANQQQQGGFPPQDLLQQLMMQQQALLRQQQPPQPQFTGFDASRMPTESSANAFASQSLPLGQQLQPINVPNMLRFPDGTSNATPFDYSNRDSNGTAAPAATPAVEQNHLRSSADASPGPLVALIGQMLPDWNFNNQ